MERDACLKVIHLALYPRSLLTLCEGQRILENSHRPFGTIVADRSPTWNMKFREAFNRVVTKEDADKMMVCVL